MPRRYALAAVAAVALAAPTAVAYPATPLTTYSTSPNVRLLANIPTGVGVGGKFSGGYYFHTTARSTGYRGPSGDAVSDGGLWVFDVENPEAPTVAAHVPLPLWQNEDVDLSPKRKILLIALDRRTSTAPAPVPVDSPQLPGVLFVYDIAEPTRPVLRSALPLPAEVGTKDGKRLHGAGHTASCVLDCTYAYVSGARDGSVLVVDLRDPDDPKVAGTVATPAGRAHKAYDPGLVHDVSTDAYGNVWMAGTGGTAMYAPVRDPLEPRLLAVTTTADNDRTNQVIHHNVTRLDRHHVLLSEEAFNGCGAADPWSDEPQGGRFQTWRIDRDTKRLVPLALFSKRVDGVRTCSSHWMDVNRHDVVADAFFEAGTRFFDVTDPTRLRQVGWFRPDDGAAGQAQYVPGRPDLVYVSDYLRGLDILKIDGGGAGARTVVERATAPAARPLIRFEPSADLGYACPVPVRIG
ncbi:MAG TPA: hypothetical protein VNA20_05840 [Frankiaceae bacterium]|nr:hypothetical protein [Frankiaceae bacterium]